MESLNLLKQEINQTMEDEHDFAKWKLIVAATLGAAALGFDKAAAPHYWLLLFIPYVCAYIDLHLYQYQARILVLAKFIRNYSAAGAANADNALQDYEKNCKTLRKAHFFDLGQAANFAASLGLSIVAPLIAFVAYSGSNQPIKPTCSAVIIWVVGFVIICILWFFQRVRLGELKSD